MNVRITKPIQGGTVKAIASKSQAHRALICTFLSGQPLSTVKYSKSCADIEATVSCLNAIKNGNTELHCEESGSTYRFLLPIVEALGQNAKFKLGERLRERCINDSGLTSQYTSGQLMALPLLPEGSTVPVQDNPVSQPYIDLTIATMIRFGVKIVIEDNKYKIEGNNKYKAPDEFVVEGDWSNAAFWLCAGAISKNPITVTGLNLESKQGDKAVVDILEKFGATVVRGDDFVTVSGDKLFGIEIDAGNIPDLVPILLVVSRAAKGETIFHNTERLKLKESDRLAAMEDVFNSLKSGTVSSWNDHRIVMSAAIAAALPGTGFVTINGAEAVNKSYPNFFEDFSTLGGQYEYLR